MNVPNWLIKVRFKTTDCMEEKQKCEAHNFSGMDKQEEIKRIREEMENLEKGKSYFKGPNQYDPVRARKVLKTMDEQLDSLRKRLTMVESWPDTSK